MDENKHHGAINISSSKQQFYQYNVVKIYKKIKFSTDHFFRIFTVFNKGTVLL